MDLVHRTFLDCLADFAFHCQKRLVLVRIDCFHCSLAQFGMDVDLGDSQRDRFLDVLITDSGSSVKDQRYAYFFVYLLQDIEVQLRLGRIDTMYISDRDCQRIASGSLCS